MADVKAILAEHQSANKQAVLKGSVEFSPAQEMQAAKVSSMMFPQPQDDMLTSGLKNVMFPINAINQGAGDVGETLANAGLGLAETALQVPEERRVTVADLMRMIDPAWVSGQELPRTQAYQQQAARNPSLEMMAGPGNFIGSMGLPIGEAQAALMKAPLLIKQMGAGIPQLAKLGNLGKEIPIAQDVAQTIAALQRGAQMSPLQGMMKNPLVGGAATGAAYANVFGAGDKFGRERQLPTPEEAVPQSLAGGALGAGMGAVQKLLAGMAMKRQIAQAAQQSPIAKIPEVSNAAELPVMLKQSPQQMYDTYLSKATKLQASGLPPQEIQRRQEGLIRAGESAGKRADLPEVGEKMAKLRAQTAGMNLSATKQAETRKFSEKKSEQGQQFRQTEADKKRQFSAQQASQRMSDNLTKLRASANQRQVERQAKETQATQHTDNSDQVYRTLFDEIDSAVDIEHLAGLEKEIHSPGAGPGGKTLIRGHQRSDLLKKLYSKRRQLASEEEAPLGENEVTGAGKPEPGTVPQNSPNSGVRSNTSSPPATRPPAKQQNTVKPASKAGQTKAPPVVPANTNQAEGTPKTYEMKVKSFLEGAFRKTLNPKEFGNRENRYKLAVSVDTLADVAELSLQETTALKRWVSELSDVRRDLTYREMLIKRLVEWADKNEDAWIGSQNKVKLERREDDKGNLYRVLEHAEREGRYKRMALTYKMESSFEEATQKNIEWTTAPKAGGGEELRPEAKPHLECVTCGKVGDSDWSPDALGKLKLAGNIERLDLGKFDAPKSADELFDRLEKLMNWRNNLRQKLRDIKGAKKVMTSDGKVALDNYDYLEDGTTPTDLFSRIFKKLEIPFVDGKAPNTHVWNVDEKGHVSTVAFHQARSQSSIKEVRSDVDQKLAKMDQLLEKVTDKDGNINYDAIWADKGLMGKLLGYFPGLSEVAILAHIFRKPIHKAGRSFARASGADTIFAGTIDDIVRDHTRFGGDAISESLHQMFGEINFNFLRDKHGEWHPINSSEELADLLNMFKGVKVSASEFRQHAVRTGKEAANKDGVPFTQDDLLTARKQADTALMLRQKSQKLADSIEEHIERMEIRKQDSQTGIPSKEGRKFYTSADLDDQGRVVVSAYSPLYHHALKELHAGLTLQSTNTASGLFGFIADTPARVSMALMRNNPATAFKNFFDQAPMTLAYFHKHFLQAAMDLHRLPDVKDAIKRLPVIPAADMANVQLQERLKDTRKAEDIGQAFFKALDKINNFLQNNKMLDPIFHGKSPLVSMADREVFAKYSALASIYKSAEMRGQNRHEFVVDLINGKLSPETTKAVMGEMSLALSQTLNSVRPDINKDLFANSAFGKLTSQYSTPGRRAMKLWTRWATSENNADRLKLVGSFAGLVAFAGSGAVPQSIQTMYRFGASLVGENEQAERNLQELDKLNLLRKIGIDWSANFGPDFMTQAKPTLESIEKLPIEAMSIAGGAHNPGEMAFNMTTALALEGLHVFPSIGPTGWGTFKKGLKGAEAAEQGIYTQYFEHNGSLQKIPITGYTYLDALRHVMIGGYEPKASDAIAQRKIDLARKQDAKYRVNKTIMPPEKRRQAAPNET